MNGRQLLRKEFGPLNVSYYRRHSPEMLELERTAAVATRRLEPALQDPVADICALRSIEPMATLVLRYEPDPADEVGKLWFELQADHFSGAAFFWSDLSELPAIIEKLGSYPFGEPATWKWGFNAKEGPEAVLALRIMQTRSDGALEASVSLSDLHDTSQRLTAKLQPDYVSLDVLRQQLRAMHTQRTGEAVLSGT